MGSVDVSSSDRYRNSAITMALATSIICGTHHEIDTHPRWEFTISYSSYTVHSPSCLPTALPRKYIKIIDHQLNRFALAANTEHYRGLYFLLDSIMLLRHLCCWDRGTTPAKAYPMKVTINCISSLTHSQDVPYLHKHSEYNVQLVWEDSFCSTHPRKDKQSAFCW